MYIRDVLVEKIDYQKEIIEKGSDLITSSDPFFRNIIKASTVCSDAVKEMLKSGKVLVRNSNNKAHSYYRGPSRNRKPVDSNQSTDDFFEKYRKKYWPDIPSRRKATFSFSAKVTSRSLDAYEVSDFGYGSQLLVVIPKNGTKYFQSKYIKDFFDSTLSNDIRDHVSLESIDRLKNALKDAEEDLENRKIDLFNTQKQYGKMALMQDEIKMAKRRVAWAEMDLESTHDEYIAAKQMQDPKKIEKSMDRYFNQINWKISQLITGSHKFEVVIEHKGYFAFSVKIWEAYIKQMRIPPLRILEPEYVKALNGAMRKIK